MSQKIYFTPGPSQLYFTVQDHLKTALKEDVMSISHRSKAFEAIFAHTREQLTELLDLPDGYDIYFTSSANEIWERIIQNLISERSHHFVNGAFSDKFFSFTKDYQKKSTSETVQDGADFENITVPPESELVSITLNETSIGFTFDTNTIKQIREANPDKLLAVDGVSAWPSVPFDFSLTDTAYFSVQKSFGLPSGLGVWIVNQRCYEKAELLEKQNAVTGSYHKLTALRKTGKKNQTPETPNTLGIYLLGKVAEDLLRRSAKSIHNETTYKSTILYQALDQSNQLSPFVPSPKNQSKTVIVAECTNGNANLLDKFSEKGWVIGKGYGTYKNNHLRIANFPMHSKEVMEQLADVISTQ